MQNLEYSKQDQEISNYIFTTGPKVRKIQMWDEWGQNWRQKNRNAYILLNVWVIFCTAVSIGKFEEKNFLCLKNGVT